MGRMIRVGVLGISRVHKFCDSSARRSGVRGNESKSGQDTVAAAGLWATKIHGRIPILDHGAVRVKTDLILTPMYCCGPLS